MRVSTPISIMVSVSDRQDHDRASACPKFSRERHVADHRQPAELQAEEQQQQQAEPEARDRQQQRRAADHREVDGAVLPPGGDQPGRHGDAGGERDGDQHDGGGDLEALEDQRQHRQAVGDRVAEIAVEHLAEPETNCTGIGWSSPSCCAQLARPAPGRRCRPASAAPDRPGSAAPARTPRPPPAAASGWSSRGVWRDSEHRRAVSGPASLQAHAPEARLRQQPAAIALHVACEARRAPSR